MLNTRFSLVESGYSRFQHLLIAYMSKPINIRELWARGKLMWSPRNGNIGIISVQQE
jgi:hypothetical protein